MKSEPVSSAQVLDAIESLRQEVGRLAERVTTLETDAKDQTAATMAPRAAADDLSEELVVVISAAIAAFLGKKTYIRQVRLDGSTTWVKWGRTKIQASHALTVRRG